MSKEYHYMLINPYIEGVNTLFSASSPMNAAKEAWQNISTYFAGELPKFHFTLERVSTESLHHFKVKEKKKKGGMIDYSIENHVSDLSSDTLSRFQQNLEDARAKGSAHKKKAEKKIQKGSGKFKKSKYDDSSSDSEDEDYYRNYNRKKIYSEQPIVYMWYDPSIYGVDKTVIPSFISPLFPPVELSFALFPRLAVGPKFSFT